VQRYTSTADKKRLADSAMAKKQGQNENAKVTNLAPSFDKPASNSLKTKG